ncbi:cation:proton antiporter, partial [bacterium]|nr:cation:proton antiporter [bacterium]
MHSEVIMLLLEIGGLLIISKIAVHFGVRKKIAPVFMLILIGLLFGPSCINHIKENHTLSFFGELGVIMLLFTAGLETDISSMKKSGIPGLAVATGGIIIPFAIGFSLGKIFDFSTMRACFIGVIMTATSVSVTVMTLWELKQLKTKIGSIILSAALIDDIICILLLSILLSIGTGVGNLAMSLVKMISFIVFTCLAGFFIFPPFLNMTKRFKAPEANLSIAIGLMLVFCGLAELAGIAPITGAYLTGLFLGLTPSKNNILEKTEVIGNAIFIPLFFILIGLQTDVTVINSSNLGFILSFVLLGILGKIFGSGIASLFLKYSAKDSLKLGVGMMPRGEVALVVIAAGKKLGVIQAIEMNATIMLVIVSAALA